METPVVSPTKVAIKWALINAMTGIVLTYVIQFLNMDPNSPVKYLTYLPFIAFMFLAQKEFKDQNGGYSTFGNGFATGFQYALFTCIITAVFIYFYLSVLSPEVFDKAMATQQTAMEEKGMSADQIEKGMSIAKKYGPIIGAVSVVLGGAFFGAIISLIGAAIFKKEKSPLEIADELAESYTPEA